MNLSGGILSLAESEEMGEEKSYKMEGLLIRWLLSGSFKVFYRTLC